MKILILILLLVIYFLPPIGNTKFDVTNCLTIVWLIFATIYIINSERIKFINRHLKKNVDAINIPNSRTPIELGYLLKGKITSSMFSISIMELIRKEALILKYYKRDYIFIYNSNMKEPLTESEQYLLNWLLKRIGNGEKVTLSQIKRDAYTNSSYFMDCYRSWVAFGAIEGTKPNFFEVQNYSFEEMFKYAGLAFVLSFIGFSVHIPLYLIIINIIMTVVLIVYTFSFNLRTKAGNEEYYQWKSFMNNLKKGNVNSDTYEPNSLEHTVIYAKLMHKSMHQVLKRELDKDQHAFDKNAILIYDSLGITDKICKKLNKLVPRAILLSAIFIKNNGSKAVMKYKESKEEKIC